MGQCHALPNNILVWLCQEPLLMCATVYISVVHLLDEHFIISCINVFELSIFLHRVHSISFKPSSGALEPSPWVGENYKYHIVIEH